MEIEAAICRILEETPENTFLTTRMITRELLERFPYLELISSQNELLKALEAVLAGGRRICLAFIEDGETLDFGIALDKKISEKMPMISLMLWRRVMTRQLTAVPG